MREDEIFYFTSWVWDFLFLRFKSRLTRLNHNIHENKEKESQQSNLSLTLFIVCSVSFLAKKKKKQPSEYECGEVKKEPVTITAERGVPMLEHWENDTTMNCG